MEQNMENLNKINGTNGKITDVAVAIRDAVQSVPATEPTGPCVTTDETIKAATSVRLVLTHEDLRLEHLRALRATLKTAYRQAACRAGLIK